MLSIIAFTVFVLLFFVQYKDSSSYGEYLMRPFLELYNKNP